MRVRGRIWGHDEDVAEGTLRTAWKPSGVALYTEK